jgi:FimV-like protein
MILFLLLVTADLQVRIDSLNRLIKNEPRSELVLQLNRLFLQAGQPDSGTALLFRFEPVVTAEERPEIAFQLAENLLYRGRFLDARDKYLETVGRYARSSRANDALERLYLLESGRRDTLLLCRLARALSLRPDDPAQCRDSLKNLLSTPVADQAYYYLGQVLEDLGDPPAALAAYAELEQKFPGHNFHRIPLREAELYIKLGDKKKAREILESLLVRDPASMYAGQAREMLKKIE